MWDNIFPKLVKRAELVKRILVLRMSKEQQTGSEPGNRQEIRIKTLENRRETVEMRPKDGEKEDGGSRSSRR